MVIFVVSVNFLIDILIPLYIRIAHTGTQKENGTVPRTAKSQISFADWELLQQSIELEPVLQSISDFPRPR
jgi:hypothetical protein